MNLFITTDSGFWIIIAAIALDLLLGDPVWLYHPVRAIGFAVRTLEPVARKLSHGWERTAGAIMSVSVIAATVIFVWGTCVIAHAVSPVSGIVMQIIWIYTALALRSLVGEGYAIAGFLRTGDISAARERTATIVSRDLSREDEHGIIRATIESLMENLSDGVIAPLLFAAIGGAPLALAYKAINTLDSMIGYRSAAYERFGWFAARLDDVANFIPARITGVLIVAVAALMNMHPVAVAKVWRRDAQKGPSPNGGIPIVAFASAAGIRLGGDCFDTEGNRIAIPYVGGNRRALSPGDIVLANRFVFLATALLVLLFGCSW